MTHKFVIAIHWSFYNHRFDVDKFVRCAWCRKELPIDPSRDIAEQHGFSQFLQHPDGGWSVHGITLDEGVFRRNHPEYANIFAEPCGIYDEGELPT